MNNIVEVRNLSRQFKKTLALDNITLDVKPGLVYGLVGANGQGKTTLIRHLLGLLRAQRGTVRVFGLDPVRSPVDVLSRVGYLSESREMPDWMKIGEYLKYSAAFHPSWDTKLEQELVSSFQLDSSKRIKDLSKGMRAQTGLIAAVAARPDLLLLDEPSTGLDAVVRKDILNAIIRTVADEGRTAIFSSHLLDEVEKMSDHVFMIDQGRLVLEGELDQIKEQHHVFRLKLLQDRSKPEIEGAISIEDRGDSWEVVLPGEVDAVRQILTRFNADVGGLRNANLSEIFIAKVGRDRIEQVTLENAS